MISSLGIEHRLRKEEQFSKEAMEGCRFATDEATITDEDASIEDRKQTSQRVCIAVDSNLGAVVGAEEGTIDFDLHRNEGRIVRSVGKCER